MFISVCDISGRVGCFIKWVRLTSDCAPEDQQPSADAPNEFVPHVVDARSYKKGPRLDHGPPINKDRGSVPTTGPHTVSTIGVRTFHRPRRQR